MKLQRLLAAASLPLAATMLLGFGAGPRHRAHPVEPAAVVGSVEPAAVVGSVGPAAVVGSVEPAAVVGSVDPTVAPPGAGAEPQGAAPEVEGLEPVRREAPVKGRSLGTVKTSWYGAAFAGRRTASGERYDPELLTAAHRSLPFGTRLRVTNPATGRSVVVRVNDRGPFVRGRSLDLSEAAARSIGVRDLGVAPVRVEMLQAS